jgi:proline dehydrogenase
MCWYKPLLWPLAQHFIAGETVAEAMAYGKKLRRKGIFPIFDVLGESAGGKQEAVRISQQYIQILNEISASKIKGDISLKLTAFALDYDEETCFRAVSRVVRHAHELKIMVWIDMESSSYTTQTLRIYRKLLQEYDNVGICIQAYLKRARKDILSLLPDEPKIRIVKGAYPEKSEAVYTSHRQINGHFKQLLRLMSEKDAWTAVGSHDMQIISHALSLPFPNHLEFQMLKGIRDDEKRLLVEHGYAVGEYVSFGEHWEKYVWRRVGERLRNLKWILLSVIGLDK